MSAILPVELREGQEVELKLGFRAPLRLSAPLCDIAMSFVMALSSWSHYTEFQKRSRHTRLTHLVFVFLLKRWLNR